MLLWRCIRYCVLRCVCGRGSIGKLQSRRKTSSSCSAKVETGHFSTPCRLQWHCDPSRAGSASTLTSSLSTPRSRGNDVSSTVRSELLTLLYLRSDEHTLHTGSERWKRPATPRHGWLPEQLHNVHSCEQSQQRPINVVHDALAASACLLSAGSLSDEIPSGPPRGASSFSISNTAIFFFFATCALDLENPNRSRRTGSSRGFRDTNPLQASRVCGPRTPPVRSWAGPFIALARPVSSLNCPVRKETGCYNHPLWFTMDSIDVLSCQRVNTGYPYWRYGPILLQIPAAAGGKAAKVALVFLQCAHTPHPASAGQEALLRCRKPVRRLG